ncbi:MAG: GNAT family N-acetyltransferase [Actinobacteria bacterium]|nr:GNAT family N-acetyltransferase [Actinomycetota bacterium]
MSLATFSIVGAASDGARWALAQYFAELESRFAGGFDTAAALAEATTDYDPPLGLFVIAELEGDIVGCGAIRWVDEATGEIKRMWVDVKRRGIGLGTDLLAHLERIVLASGRTTAVLDTNETLTEAIELYRRAGYAPVDRYNDNPYAHLWFSKQLNPGQAASDR